MRRTQCFFSEEQTVGKGCMRTFENGVLEPCFFLRMAL